MLVCCSGKVLLFGLSLFLNKVSSEDTKQILLSEMFKNDETAANFDNSNGLLIYQ